jgi:hypothetical protein
VQRRNVRLGIIDTVSAAIDLAELRGCHGVVRRSE